MPRQTKPKQNGKSKRAHQADETEPSWFFKACKKRKGAERNAEAVVTREASAQICVDDGGLTCLAEAVV